MNLKLLGACSALSLLMFADTSAMERAARQFDKARAMGLKGVEEYNAVKRDAHAVKDGKVKVADYVASVRDNLEEGQTLRDALTAAHNERIAAQKEEATPEVVAGTPEVEGGESLRSPSPDSEGDIDGVPSIEDREGANEEGPQVKGRFFKRVEGLSFDLDEFKAGLQGKSFAELNAELESLSKDVAEARGGRLHVMTPKERIAENDAKAKIKEISEAINRFAAVSVDELDKDGLLFEKDRLEAKGEKALKAEKTRLEAIELQLQSLEDAEKLDGLDASLR